MRVQMDEMTGRVKAYFIYLRCYSKDDFFNFSELLGDIDESQMIYRNGEIFVLYALTDDRNILKDFIRCRNMKRFILKEVVLSKEEYEEIASSIPNSELLIHGLITKKVRNDKIVQDMALLSTTGTEVNYVHLNGMVYLNEKFDSGTSDAWFRITTDIFKKEYEIILCKVFQLHDLLSSLYPNDESLPWNPYYLDEVGIFLDAYSELLNEEEVLKCAYTDTTERMQLQKRRLRNVM